MSTWVWLVARSSARAAAILVLFTAAAVFACSPFQRLAW